MADPAATKMTIEFVSDTQHPRKFVLSGVVAMPVGVNDCILDGKIGLWKCGAYVTAQRGSKYHKKGQSFMSLNKSHFVSMCIFNAGPDLQVSAKDQGCR